MDWRRDWRLFRGHVLIRGFRLALAVCLCLLLASVGDAADSAVVAENIPRLTARDLAGNEDAGTVTVTPRAVPADPLELPGGGYQVRSQYEEILVYLIPGDCFSYDKTGNLTAEVNADGSAIYYEYDRAGRQTKITYETVGEQTFGYDAVGNIVSATDARGTAYFAYDKANRLVAESQPGIGTTYFAYDIAGNRTSIIDPDGGETLYTYDARNRMESVLSPDSKATYYEYNANDRQVKKILGDGSFTYFTYDAARRSKDILNCKNDGSPLSYFQYERDAAGNIAAAVREDGNVIYYGYDAAERLAEEKWRDSGGSGIYAFEYEYDAAGNRAYQKKGGVESYYEYDGANALTRKHIL